jgi:methionyl-tRNA formyltransferase
LRILFLTNNKISEPLFEWLKKTEEVLLFEEKLTIEKFIQVKPDLVVSYNYKYIIKKDVLELLFKCDFINLHISLLPWNRGCLS